MPDVTQIGALRVTGLGDVVRALKKAGVDATDLRDVIYDVGMIVVNATSMRVKSGAMQATLRAGRGKQKAVVRAGGGAVPYAAVQEYGYSASNISGSFAMNEARAAEMGAITDRLESGIEDVLRRAGLL